MYYFYSTSSNTGISSCLLLYTDLDCISYRICRCLGRFVCMLMLQPSNEPTGACIAFFLGKHKLRTSTWERYAETSHFLEVDAIINTGKRKYWVWLFQWCLFYLIICRWWYYCAWVQWYLVVSWLSDYPYLLGFDNNRQTELRAIVNFNKFSAIFSRDCHRIAALQHVIRVCHPPSLHGTNVF